MQLKNIKTSRALTQLIFCLYNKYSFTNILITITAPAMQNSDIHRDRRFLTIYLALNDQQQFTSKIMLEMNFT